MPEIEIVISGGEGRAVYSDELAPYVRALGGTIERATYVEPLADGTWCVDLTRFGVKGIIEGFQTRQAALDWELAWLKRNWLNSKPRLKSMSQKSGTCCGTPKNGFSRLLRFLGSIIGMRGK